MNVVDLTFALILAAALGTGLVGGAFYAFSSFIMRALGQLPVRDGLAAMQAINVAAIRPPFMLGFVGTALLAVGTLGMAALRWHAAGSPFTIAGAALYLVGCFGLTIARNVPLNNALATLDPANPTSAARWTAYLVTWTTWNHVRTIASLAASTAFIFGLVARAAQP